MSSNVLWVVVNNVESNYQTPAFSRHACTTIQAHLQYSFFPVHITSARICNFPRGYLASDIPQLFPASHAESRRVSETSSHLHHSTDQLRRSKCDTLRRQKDIYLWTSQKMRGTVLTFIVCVVSTFCSVLLYNLKPSTSKGHIIFNTLRSHLSIEHEIYARKIGSERKLHFGLTGYGY